MGLDLAQKKDFAALCLVFPRGDEWHVCTRLYLNELAVQESGNAHLVEVVALATSQPREWFQGKATSRSIPTRCEGIQQGAKQGHRRGWPAGKE
jgi:hypothetical protein